MDKQLEKVQDVVLDKTNQICSKFGLNNIMAQLYTILYFNNKPLSLNDMSEQLKISKGSTSTNIRALERYGAVRQVWVKGSRRDHYIADNDISKIIFDRVKAMAQNRLSEVSDMINSAHLAIDSVSPDTEEVKEAIKIFEQKLDNLKNLHEKAYSLFRLFNSSFLNKLLNIKFKKNNIKEELSI